MVGVYCIRNIVNNNIYIGSSIKLNLRTIQHRTHLNKNKHHSKYLQNAWNKYGKDNFIFEILEYCTEDTIIEREQNWIDFFKPEYNMNPTAYSCKGRILTNEHKLKISKKHVGKTIPPEQRLKMSITKKKRNKSEFDYLSKLGVQATIRKVIQYDLNNNFLKEWNSITEAAIGIKGDSSTISKVCRGKLSTHRNYKWKYKENASL